MPGVKGQKKRQRQGATDERRRMWSVIRMLRRFDLNELEEASDCAYPTVRRFVRPLMLSGILALEHEARGHEDRNRYRLAKDLGPEPPIVRSDYSAVFDVNSQTEFVIEAGETARDRAWALMREGEAFELRDLVELGVQKHNGLKFIGALIEAGYLTLVRARKPGPGGYSAAYQLIRDTGERTPVVKRSGAVEDPNL
ncbi:MAG: hypothetical protein AAFX78_01800 [Cyanobacteria bacterium J06638_20]